jgi:hypothetical protein
MGQKSIDARLAKAGQLLAEIEELPDIGVRVVILALLRSLGTEDVAN